MIKKLTKFRIFIKKFLHNQAIAPFETVFGFFCAYGGLAGLFKFGIVLTAYSQAISGKFLVISNTLYLISGLAIFIGLGIRRGDIEAFGLILLATVLVVRTLIFSFVFGLNPVIVNSYILNAAFIFSSIIRLKTIIKNNRFIESHGVDTKLLPL